MLADYYASIDAGCHFTRRSRLMPAAVTSLPPADAVTWRKAAR